MRTPVTLFHGPLWTAHQCMGTHQLSRPSRTSHCCTVLCSYPWRPMQSCTTKIQPGECLHIWRTYASGTLTFLEGPLPSSSFSSAVVWRDPVKSNQAAIERGRWPLPQHTTLPVAQELRRACVTRECQAESSPCVPWAWLPSAIECNLQGTRDMSASNHGSEREPL